MKQATNRISAQVTGTAALFSAILFWLLSGLGTYQDRFAEFGLPNPHLLAALLGGLLGLWLSLGGPRRIAAVSGWLIGVFAAWLLWRGGASYVWVIEAVLVAVFGPEAAAFTSLAAFMLLFGLMRWAAGVGMKVVTALLARGAKWETRRAMVRATSRGQRIESAGQEPG